MSHRERETVPDRGTNETKGALFLKFPCVCSEYKRRDYDDDIMTMIMSIIRLMKLITTCTATTKTVLHTMATTDTERR